MEQQSPDRQRFEIEQSVKVGANLSGANLFGANLNGANLNCAYLNCANLSGTHSCAGQSKVDNAPDEWKYVAKGSCKDLKGMTADEAKAAMTMKK